MALRKGRTITVKERPTYDALCAQMYAGTIRGWWAYEKDEWEIMENDGTRVALTFAEAQQRAGTASTGMVRKSAKPSKDELREMLRLAAAWCPTDLRDRALEMVAA